VILLPRKAYPSSARLNSNKLFYKEGSVSKKTAVVLVSVIIVLGEA
jgi:hypothetical protein